MKPLKKKGLQTKKSVNGNSSTPRIDNYFKAAAKELNLDVEEAIVADATDERALKSIYIDALKKKLQDFGGEVEATDSNNIVEPEERAVSDTEVFENEEGAVGGTGTYQQEEGAVGTKLIAHESVHGSQNGSEPAKCLECVEWKTKYDDLQKFCLKLTIRNADMDLKYDDLLKTKTVGNQVSTDGVASSTIDFLTPRELQYLECISLDKKADSTFVHHCLLYMYKDNLPILSNRTLKGKAEVLHISEDGEVERVVEGKDPLTPPKVDRMRSLYIERISKTKSVVGAVEFSERIKDTNFNRLIAAGLYNISKKN